jgi:hypothetical protein
VVVVEPVELALTVNLTVLHVVVAAQVLAVRATTVVVVEPLVAAARLLVLEEMV